MIRFKQLLELAYEADINLAAWGAHGIGKTAIVQQFVRDEGIKLGLKKGLSKEDAEKNWGEFAHLETMILSQVDPVTIAGYPGRTIEPNPYHNPKVEGSKEERLIMDTACPDWIVRLQDAGAQGKMTVLFLDEFNRADRYAHNAAMTLVLDKRVNGHELPKDCFIVVAMNPETQGDMGVNPLTDPMVDRFCHIGLGTVPANLAKGFIRYGQDSGIHSTVVDFIQQNTKSISGWTLNFDEAIGNRIKPTPRSWEAVGKIMKALTNDDNSLDEKRLTNVGADLIGGLVGKTLVPTFMTFAKDNFVKPFSFDEIMNTDKVVLKRVHDLVDKNQTQVIIASLENFHREAAQKKVKVTDFSKGWHEDKTKRKGFTAFITALPADIQSTFWAISTEDQRFWSNVMHNIPLEVCAAIN